MSIAESQGVLGAHPLAEGIETAGVTRALARKLQVEMPIVEAVAAVIAGELSVDDAIVQLMARPLKRELD